MVRSYANCEDYSEMHYLRSFMKILYTKGLPIRLRNMLMSKQNEPLILRILTGMSTYLHLVHHQRDQINASAKANREALIAFL